MGKRDQGITLMEMMIAVAVVAILLIVSMLSFREQLGKGRDARRKEDIHTIKSAVEQYYDDFGCYPEPDKVTCGSTQLAPYIAEVPCDPINKGNYIYDYSDDQCSDYIVYARLEHESDPIIESLGCEIGCGPTGVYNYYVSSAGFDVARLTPTPTVTPSGSPSPTNGPGMCGGTCVANECATCCPGADYRCDAAGTGCFYDATCTNP